MKQSAFVVVCLAVAAIVFFYIRLIGNEYYFFAGYVVLQFIVLATAWNILGGYTGYVNFGSAAFFGVGAYATVFFEKTYPLPIPVLIVIGGVISGIIGLGMGYLTLRLRGAFFAIGTLALAVVLSTIVTNWHYLGGGRGAYVLRPAEIAVIGPYIQYLFLLMLGLAVLALAVARGIERSQLGYGFATIRDDELAAEACGVPTLRLKLIATTISGALMGMAGAPFPYYLGYVQPASAFGLEYAVNSIAMPMIGGTASWVGPLIGAILLAALQQWATVTFSSEAGVLLIGILLVDMVIIAPSGIVGLFRERKIGAPRTIEPAVFGVLYVLNLVPMYFLLGQAQAAQWMGLIFWGILVFLAYIRGRELNRTWLIAFPVAGALVSMIPATAGTPAISGLLAWLQGPFGASLDAVTLTLALSTFVQAIAVVCGLVPTRRTEQARVRA